MDCDGGGKGWGCGAVDSPKHNAKKQAVFEEVNYPP